MADRKLPSWMIGCGIGCGALVLLVAVVIGAGALLVRRTTQGFDKADTARQALEEKHGTPEKFTPPADGSIPAARMEAFLSVREALRPHRVALAGTFERLPMSREAAEELKKKSRWEKLQMVFSIGKEAMGLGAEMGDFFRTREETMLAAGMGMGEYEYIYTIAYYSWLGRSPEEGPSHEKGGEEHNEFRMMGPRVMRRVRSDLIAILRNQHTALPAEAPAAWRDRLAAEIEALENDEERIPWKGDLPEAIASSLAPWKEKLEANYLPAANPFELARNSRRGRWSYTAD